MSTSRLALGLSFIAGACATAATTSTAQPPAPAAALVAAVASPRAKVIPAAQAEQRRAPNDSGTVTILARGDNAFLARLELQPGAKVPEHQDATEEYIHVLEGGGAMVIDGESFELAPGDTVYMPPDATVSFTNADMPMVAIQVFAGPEPAVKYDAWTKLAWRSRATKDHT